MEYTLHQGDCIEVMKGMPDCSVDSIVTDPPYHLTTGKKGSTGFMGKIWDGGDIAQCVEVWAEALRVLKPGGYLLAFSSTRTQHRMVCAIEDAGFEVRDQIMWVYSQGFPKSHNLDGDYKGWGTALKPAHEPVCMARKPLDKGLTVAGNVLKYGTGGLNIDGCRIPTEHTKFPVSHGKNIYGGNALNESKTFQTTSRNGSPEGRWPANFIHDGLEEEWSRFFYCAKASKRDRDEGIYEFADFRPVERQRPDGNRQTQPRKNTHPTVKPTALMAYLCRLVTPPGGVVLDPFMGSGSTGKACMREGFRFIGIDLQAEYVAIANSRIKSELTKVEVEKQPDLFTECI